MRTTLLNRAEGFWRRKLLLQQACRAHGAPVYICCRAFGLSSATLELWLQAGLLPRRRASRVRLASLLMVDVEQLERITRDTLQEVSVNHDFQSECSHR